MLLPKQARSLCRIRIIFNSQIPLFKKKKKKEISGAEDRKERAQSKKAGGRGEQRVKTLPASNLDSCGENKTAPRKAFPWASFT